MSGNSYEGKVVYSVVEVSVAPNYTTAFMSFSKPEGGGQEMTYDKVLAAINDKLISHGILEDEIRG